MERTILILISLSLSSCMSPRWHEGRMAKRVGNCVNVGEHIDTVAECLSVRGVDIDYYHRYKRASLKKCGPYWGTPFIASCGYLSIETDDEKKVINWRVSGGFDAV